MSLRWFSKRPTGADPKDLFDQWLIDRTDALTINDSPTIQVASAGPKGITLKAAPSGSGGTSLIQCVITELFSSLGEPKDYIGVTQYNISQNQLVGSQFNCAKCITGRMPDTELIDGFEVAYAYNDDTSGIDPDNTRFAFFTGYAEQREVVHPRYMVYQNPLPAYMGLSQCLIEVAMIKNSTDILGDGSNIMFMEQQPNRHWAYSVNQTNLVA